MSSEKYYRGPQKKAGYSKDKKLNAGLKKLDKQYKDAVKSAAATDILLPEDAGFLEAEGMEKTYKYSQKELQQNVDVATSKKHFDLKLPEYGPYNIDYTRNGRSLLIGGKKGHVASFDWQKGSLDCELFLNETVHDVKYLHNDQFFAAAQKKYTFIYDKQGTEVHRLKQHIEATNLDFLPYHYLLVSSGKTGYLKYHDVTTGELVSELRTKLGPTVCMTQNPWNAVMHLGHSNGTVTMWAPNMPVPLAKVQTSRGPVRAVSVNRDGRYMVVAGADRNLKIWDVRNFKEVESYYTPTPATSLDISDTGLVSVGWGSHVTIWKDLFKSRQNSPYMNHLNAGSTVCDTSFVPFEDVLGLGHDNGFSSIVVPGSGEANFDALEVNPFETAKQRQQSEVLGLMNKLSPDMISLDPNVIGSVDKRAVSKRLRPQDLEELRKSTKAERISKMEVRPEVKGKNSALRRHLRKKKQNVVDERKLRVQKNLAMEKENRAKIAGGKDEEVDVLGPALSRFS